VSKLGTSLHSEDGKAMSVSGLSLIRTNLAAMVIPVIVVLLSGFVAYLQYSTLISSSQNERYYAEAGRMASHLGGRLQALGDVVAELAVPDTALVEAIKARDTNFLRKREASLKSHFPVATRVRYILPGEDQVDNTITPPLSYACLELARLAEQGQATPPFEVHLFGGEIEHLDLLRPVMLDGKLIASLIVTLDVETLKQWVDELQPDGGYVELEQGVENDVIKLFGRGDASLKDKEPGYSAPIENSYWQLDYWPSGRLGMAEARHVGFLVTFAIAAGAMVLFFILYGAFLSLMVRADLNRMINFIVDSNLGKRFQSYPVRLAEVKRVLQEKEADLSVMSSYAETRDAIHDKAEHFMPDMSVDESGISVEEVASTKPAGDGGKTQ